MKHLILPPLLLLMISCGRQCVYVECSMNINSSLYNIISEDTVIVDHMKVKKIIYKEKK